MTHEECMKLAIEQAGLAANEGNAPFGVVVIDGQGNVIAQDHDRVRELMDPLAHGGD